MPEGLLKAGEDYKIEYKNKELLINGKKQSQQTTDKYRKYFRDNSNITIEKKDGSINIDHDRDHDDDGDDHA